MAGMMKGYKINEDGGERIGIRVGEYSISGYALCRVFNTNYGLADRERSVVVVSLLFTSQHPSKEKASWTENTHIWRREKGNGVQ